MHYAFLAVDAGGTHTRATLIDAHGRVCGRGEAGAANWSVHSRAAWAAAIRKSVAQACASLGGVPPRTHLWVGTAGVQVGDGVEAAEALVREVVACASVRVTNDAALLHRASGRPCLVAIAGTGSVVLAFSTPTTVQQWGGLGWLLGDEGSAFALGRAAVRAVLTDRVGTHDLRTRLERAAWPLDADGVRRLYASDNPRALLASLAPCVTAAAEAGDDVASTLLREETAMLATYLAQAMASLPAAEAADLRLGGALMQVALSSVS
ncbi:hypothetical protein MEQU1_001647 [Malassezia equina]|uniref:N-acetyl-D-glucosamine kinase n=1 Tax=Malassezia equina TaxID=1381935 RepID=A0AAF0ECE4_9BASI|nr:hypothetical protein MEQU1_001647 [Malassezia equina]